MPGDPFIINPIWQLALGIIGVEGLNNPQSVIS